MKALFPSLLAVALVPGVIAQSAASPVDAVYACAVIATDAERLACYDAAVGRLKQAEATGEITTVSRAEVEAVKRESFGFSLPSIPNLFARKAESSEGPPAEEFREMTLAVSKVTADSTGKLTVYLDTGAVWRQIDTTAVRIRKKTPPKSASIEKAAFGSYLMKLDDGKAFRAKRIE